MKILITAAALAAVTLATLGTAYAANRGAFCRQAKGTASLDCHYASARQCQYEATPAGDSCIQNPRWRRSTTTGSGVRY